MKRKQKTPSIPHPAFCPFALAAVDRILAQALLAGDGILAKLV